MNIKNSFTLIKGTPNILDLSKSEIQSFTLDGNTPRHVYVSLELKKNMINHIGFKKILNYVQNVKTTDDFNILFLEQYPLVASYNRKTNSKIVNIAPFNTKELSRVYYLNLYGATLYAYIFESLVTKRLRVPDNLAQPISNFFFSLFVQLFGRDYGMTGTYSSKLPGLKFLITAYILIAFFGRKQDRMTYKLSQQYSGYQFEEQLPILNRIDLSDIHGLIRALSLTDIMPGFNIIRFTTKATNIFDLQMLPAFEDLSRFLSILAVSKVGGQNISKSFIKKYNLKIWARLTEFVEKKLF
jgi:hypothetical protein